MIAPGSLLAQVQDNSGSAQLAYSAAYHTEIQNIVVCNTHSAQAAFCIYHDDDGAVYTRNSALYFETVVDGNSTLLIGAAEIGAGISVSAGGTIGVKSLTTSAFTISIYGTTRTGR